MIISNYKKTLLGLSLVCIQIPGVLGAGESDWTYAAETHEQHAEKMDWWNDARFGMFVHWGVYSVTGGKYKGEMPTNSAEWMMNKARIPIADYKVENVDKFNPKNFDAKYFVQLAKEAGMKYIVITAKHHDGFSMFHSKSSTYNVVDESPFGRDVMKELAVACQEEGIRFGFYYSQCQDWHHPGGMGNDWDDSIERVTFDEYVREKAVPEARQLLTEYGPISIFWWDTPREMSEEAFASLHSVTDLQPGIITNDRLGEDHRGDHKTFERRIPNRAPEGADWEVCMPISASWGYKSSDTSFKSSERLIRNLIDIASKGGNYLLNVSPTGDGDLLPQAIERLKRIGQWMKVNSESIYETTASPFGKLDWGRCTKKEFARGSNLYLHIFDWPADGKLHLPGLKNKVEQAYMMADWSGVSTERSEGGVTITLPATAPDDIASVVVLKVGGPLEVEVQLPKPNEDGVLALGLDTVYIHNNEGSQNARIRDGKTGIDAITRWTDENAWIEWSFQTGETGTYEVWGEYSLDESKSNLNIGLGGQQHPVELQSTGGAQNFKKRKFGSVTIDAAGDYRLSIRPEAGAWSSINLRGLELKKR